MLLPTRDNTNHYHRLITGITANIEIMCVYPKLAQPWLTHSYTIAKDTPFLSLSPSLSFLVSSHATKRVQTSPRFCLLHDASVFAADLRLVTRYPRSCVWIALSERDYLDEQFVGDILCELFVEVFIQTRICTCFFDHGVKR